MVESFESAWENRHDYTIEVRQSYEESDWAKGRETYLSFLIPVDDYIIRDAITTVQQELDNISCIATLPEDYLHITVRGVGFVRKEGEYEDDVHPGEIGRIIQQAENLLQYHHPFTIHVQKLNLFPRAVFAEVHDNDAINSVNQTLQRIDRLPPFPYDAPNLLPHISIAQFRNRHGLPHLLETLEKYRDWDAGLTTVDTIHLAKADTTQQPATWEPVHTFTL